MDLTLRIVALVGVMNSHSDNKTTTLRNGPDKDAHIRPPTPTAHRVRSGTHPVGVPAKPGGHTRDGSGQNRSVGRYSPHTSRSVPQTSPTVARARRASFIG